MNARISNKRPQLGELEWKVVEMARADGPRSLKPAGFLVELMRDLLGFPVPNQLANKGLEALRCLCVRAWYWNLIEVSDLQAVAEAGYSWSDVRRILPHIAAPRGFTPSIQEIESKDVNQDRLDRLVQNMTKSLSVRQ